MQDGTSVDQETGSQGSKNIKCDFHRKEQARKEIDSGLTSIIGQGWKDRNGPLVSGTSLWGDEDW